MVFQTKETDINIASHSAMLTNELIIKQFKLLDENIIRIITYNDLSSIRIAYATLINLYSYLFSTTLLTTEQRDTILQTLNKLNKEINTFNQDKISIQVIENTKNQIIDLTFLIKYYFQQMDYFFRLTKDKETLFSYYQKRILEKQEIEQNQTKTEPNQEQNQNESQPNTPNDK